MDFLAKHWAETQRGNTEEMSFTLISHSYHRLCFLWLLFSRECLLSMRRPSLSLLGVARCTAEKFANGRRLQELFYWRIFCWCYKRILALSLPTCCFSDSLWSRGWVRRGYSKDTDMLKCNAERCLDWTCFSALNMESFSHSKLTYCWHVFHSKKVIGSTHIWTEGLPTWNLHVFSMWV